MNINISHDVAMGQVTGFRVQGSGFRILLAIGMLVLIFIIVVQGLLDSSILFAQSVDAGTKTSQWKAPAAASVKSQAMDWLRERKADPTALAKAEDIWAQASRQIPEEELLIRLSATFALIDENADKLVVLCSQPRGNLMLSDQAWLGDPQTPPFVARNLRLLYAQWLVQESLLEEAREQISSLEPSDVVAPAMLLFYQSVAYHKLLQKESGLKTIEQLLGSEEIGPRRYIAVARLMQDDLSGLEDDSLDHIARRMDDIRRRLHLGRTGPKVREVEDGVIDSLDKLIKKIEQQQQQSQSSAGGNTLRPSNPALDSVPMSGKGPGDVTKRDIGSESDWGDLPPKQREEALQQIGRDFPSHYRDVIEQYFKKLASEGGE